MLYNPQLLGVLFLNSLGKGNVMRIIKIFVFAMFGVLALPVFAAETAESNSSPVTYNVGIASDYIFRGITQTTHSPAIQGGVDYEHSSGLYLGTWASNVRRIKDFGAVASGDANVELDTYFGIKNAIANDYGYDFGYVRYNYMGTYVPQVGFDNADTAEIYGAASYKFVSLKYSYSLLDGFITTPSSRGSNYVDLTANYPFEDAGLAIGAHVGKQTYVGAVADQNSIAGLSPTYTDYKLSASKDFNSYVLSLSYTTVKGTSFWTPNGDPWGRAATSLSLTHLF